ncbi:succinylglutamate desuccinylase/aspartoacylase family protein [Patescibacteria group bacterium]|nr:succinylglutamate desuccinylase/aspartoacylase family protein [Patescibacteria group bacterium]
MDDIITIKGEKPGKTVAIIGGTHGNEVCGVELIKELRNSLKIDCGTVYLIFGNPQAIKKNVRQIDMNLNRAFLPDNFLSQDQIASYESQRAKEIMPYLEKCDASLDIHSSPTPESPPFIICASNTYEIVKNFPFRIVSTGWDKVEPGATEEFVDSHGGKGICVECGFHNDVSAIDIARQTAMIFLENMGLIDKLGPKIISKKQKHIHVFYIYITINNFTPSKHFKDFEKIRKDTLIGYDKDTEIRSPSDGYILFCKKCDQRNKEAFLLAKDDN